MIGGESFNWAESHELRAEGSCPEVSVSKLWQNPITLVCLELLSERKQLPQVVDIRHFRVEGMEGLEARNILRKQQVACGLEKAI